MLKIKDDKLQKYLLMLSIVLWGISLALPAVYYAAEDSYFPGYLLLLIGLLLGWLGAANGGLLVYTNLFYFWALVGAIRNKNYFKCATIAFVAGLSSFLLRRLPVISDNGGSAMIYSWQWGSIFWISAYAVLFLLLSWQRYPKHKQLILRLLLSIPMLWIAIGLFGFYQYSQANDEEKERIFKPLTAFAVAPLSHIPYTPIGITLKKNDIIEIKGEIGGKYDMNLVQGDYFVRTPPQFIYKNKYYVRSTDRSDDWIVAKTVSQETPIDFTLSFYSDGEQSGIRISDKQQKTIAWQAPLIVKQGRWNSYIYPDYEFYDFYQPLHNNAYLPKDGSAVMEPCQLQATAIEIGGYEKYRLHDLDIYYDGRLELDTIMCYRNSENIFIVSSSNNFMNVLDIKSQVFSDYFHLEGKEMKTFFVWGKQLEITFKSHERYLEIIVTDENGSEQRYINN